MNILFDEGTPRPLRAHLPDHSVDLPIELGWAQISNGELLARAEASGYDLLISTDTNLRHQQNLSQYNIAVLVIRPTNWNTLQSAIPRIVETVNFIQPSDYVEIRA
jgi:hypothetical protein